MTKLKTTELPSRANKLFIQLYCEKRGGATYENLHNAAQSWLSLSLTKKKLFYDTISTKSAIKRAQLIIQTEPYLKEKFPSKVRRGNEKSVDNKEHQKNEGKDAEAADNTITSVHDDDDTTMACNNNSYAEEHNVLNGSKARSNSYQYRNESDKSDAHKDQQPYTSVIEQDADTADEFDKRKNTERTPSLVEPVLPIAKTGKELFYLLQARQGDNKCYESLTTKEKRVYGRAVSAIKTDYVKKYKEYLESLTPRQLFDCYKKIF